MQSLKSWVTPAVTAAVLGLGFGLGSAQHASAADPSCRQLCNIEFRECRASGDDFYLCRLAFSACLRNC